MTTLGRLEKVELRDMLLPKLLTGEIEIPEDDEMMREV